MGKTITDLLILGFLGEARSDISESVLGDHIGIKLNDPKAHLWVTRRGSTKTVGSVTKEFSPYHFGLTVRNTDKLDPRYLYYMLQHIHHSGHYRKLANGTTNLVHIKREHITNIPMVLNEENERYSIKPKDDGFVIQTEHGMIDYRPTDASNEIWWVESKKKGHGSHLVDLMQKTPP